MEVAVLLWFKTPKPFQMRRVKKKIIAGLLIVFILCVSYIILRPEIATENNTQDHPISRTDVINDLIGKFKLNWDLPLSSPWVVAERWVSPRYIHPGDTLELGAVLQALAKKKIISADVGYKGTQLKMLLTLEGGQKAAFKPRWYPRNKTFSGIYDGSDRHNGEIAAYHLGRILEFRRSPIVVGRYLNLDTEILPVATQKLKSTFFKQDGNVCFFGKCYYCKGPETGVCGNGTILEGVMMLWLPSSTILKSRRHPWRRTYKADKLAIWETDNNFCNTSILVADMYTKGPLLMDIVDTAVFDFLIGNADRHMFHTTGEGDNLLFLLLDNGKSFGNPYHDEVSILAPLYQCCQIRESTWLRLLALQDNILSEVLHVVLDQDPIAPVLTKDHLDAMDRRLRTALNSVHTCISKFSTRSVLITDR